MRHKNESLQSVNAKLEEAESMIVEYQDKLRKAEQARQYAETHQRKYKAKIQRASELLLTAGKSAAQAGNKLPNETAALLAHWLFFLAVTVAITAATGALIFLAARRIWKNRRKSL